MSDKSKPLKIAVYERLKDDIMSGALPLGSRLGENSLARQYNVSRTPVREAIGLLLQDGIAEVSNDGGVIVKCPTIEDIREIYAIMVALSDLIVKHSIEMITESELNELYGMADMAERQLANGDIHEASRLCSLIHDLIWDASYMPNMVHIMHSLPKFWRYRFISDNIDPQRHAQSILQHRELIDCIAARDQVGYHKLFADHMNASCDDCILAYERFSNSKNG